MEKKYWEDMFVKYEKEIFDVLKLDKKGVIKSSIIELGSSKKVVGDIGCAVGKWLTLLSEHFKQVYAIDFSKNSLEYAEHKYEHLKNIVYRNIDMTKATMKGYSFDVALCVNAVMMDSYPKRSVFFKGLSTCVKNNGYLILVVPSLESSLYSEFRYSDWNVKKGILPKKKSKTDTKYTEVKQGVAEVDKVPHKHYLKEELIIILEAEGFKIEKIEKVEYNWETEFVGPPNWMKDPYPWDWMVVARKIK